MLEQLSVRPGSDAAIPLQDVVLTLIKEAMLKNTAAKGFLIDGYPRELEQGTRFETEVSTFAWCS